MGLFRSTPRITVINTTDIGLAAYLWLCGARLEGVATDVYPATFVLSHRRILKMAKDFHSHRWIYFAPKAFLNKRSELKKFLPNRGHRLLKPEDVPNAKPTIDEA